MKSATLIQPGAVRGSVDITSATRTPARDCWFNTRASSSRATVNRNQPMKASHTPLRRDRVRNSTSPSTIRPIASTRPARAAPREARVLSPYRRHRIAWRTRPPSKGAPGSRLNSASSRLTPDSHPATPTASGAAATARKLAATPAKRADSRRLVSGPENALQNWVRGVWASPSIRVTPPKSTASPRTPPSRRDERPPHGSLHVPAATSAAPQHR